MGPHVTPRVQARHGPHLAAPRSPGVLIGRKSFFLQKNNMAETLVRLRSGRFLENQKYAKIEIYCSAEL
jgi:hypothetical protein